MSRALVAIVGVLVALSGCARNDGRTLQPPAAGATTPTTTALSPLPVDPGSTAAGGVINLASPSFVEGGAMPSRFTCDAENLSPPLQWSGIPEATVELALVVTDPDAYGVVHWVVAALDPLLTGLGEGGVPEAAAEAVNSESEIGWSGPCTPIGVNHRYVFTLYALETPSGVAEGEPAADAISKIAQQPGVATTLSATYQRRG